MLNGIDVKVSGLCLLLFICVYLFYIMVLDNLIEKILNGHDTSHSVQHDFGYIRQENILCDVLMEKRIRNILI